MIKPMSQLVTLFFIALLCTPVAAAKSNKSTNGKATKKVAPSSKKSQLGTSFSFDAASVRGKYQMNGQGIATVEDEKVLDDLLGLRKNFKDREKQELSRR